jgi:hypothetical protein
MLQYFNFEYLICFHILLSYDIINYSLSFEINFRINFD